MTFSFLKTPYPLSDSNSGKIRAAFFTGLFVFAFLFFFRPFQLHVLENLKALMITAGYGLVTVIMVLFNAFVLPSLLPKVFDENKWTVGREISYLLWIIFTIGIGNALYSDLLFDDVFDTEYLLQFQVMTLMVALLPVTINVLVMQLLLTRRNLKAAHLMSDHMHHKRRLDATPEATVIFRSDNQKEMLKLLVRDLLYITSADNYIEIHFLEQGLEQKKLLRGTLKNAKDELRSYTAFYRCHRAWLVNLDRVISVTGNSQGYRLILEGTETKIPVSRNLNEELNNRLAK